MIRICFLTTGSNQGTTTNTALAICCAILLVILLGNVQVESAISVQKLKPTIDAIKRQYGEDKDKIQRETSALYEKAGVNPLAGTSHAHQQDCWILTSPYTS